MESSPRLGAAAALLEEEEEESSSSSSTHNEKRSARSRRSLRSRRRRVARRRNLAMTPGELGGPQALRERYDGCERNEILGLGGMGEVRLLADRRIGREVAIKLLRDGGTSRFLREARVQGQLEHPSIVPVYDVGVDDDGQVYFTMKRVRGTTLREVMKDLHAERHLGAPTESSNSKRGGSGSGSSSSSSGSSSNESSGHFTQHKLLSAFAQVCLAVDFAHSRGVVHRDLKPSNIMLGSFGEVYVLDWGVAKLLREEADGHGPCESGELPISDVSDPDQTAIGECIGTPGYMAPEQIEGKAQDARTDVYALGAILFEILALSPLHRGTLEQRLHSSLEEIDVHARVKAEGLAIDVPADLAHVIQRCVELNPSDRFPSARALHTAIETYLEGNRDAEQRRMRAASLAETATERVEQAIGGCSIDPTNEHRRAAMRAISKALSLDPSNEEAMRAFVRLITEAPRNIPKEVEEELSSEYQEGRRTASRTIPLAGFAFLAFIPLAVSSGVRNWPLLIGLNASWVVAICVQLLWGRAKKERAVLLSLPFWCVAVGLVSSVFGPYILTPALACFVAICFVLHSASERSKALRRIFVTGMACASVLVPVLLEKLGLITPAYEFTNGQMVVLPRVHGLTAFPLLLGSLALILIPALLLGRVRDSVRKTRLRTLLTTWHLKQFLPGAGRELPNRE